MEQDLSGVREIALDHLTRPRRDTDRNSLNKPQVQVGTKADEEDAKVTGLSALDLVRQTAHLIKVVEERGQALADQAQELAQRAVNELMLAEARIRLLEEQLLRAETRARESEEWLQRVHNNIQRNLLDRSAPALPSRVA